MSCLPLSLSKPPIAHYVDMKLAPLLLWLGYPRYPLTVSLRHLESLCQNSYLFLPFLFPFFYRIALWIMLSCLPFTVSLSPLDFTPRSIYLSITVFFFQFCLLSCYSFTG